MEDRRPYWKVGGKSFGQSDWNSRVCGGRISTDEVFYAIRDWVGNRNDCQSGRAMAGKAVEDRKKAGISDHYCNGARSDCDRTLLWIQQGVYGNQNFY